MSVQRVPVLCPESCPCTFDVLPDCFKRVCKGVQENLILLRSGAMTPHLLIWTAMDCCQVVLGYWYLAT